MTPFVLLYVYLLFVLIFTVNIKNSKVKAKNQCLLSFWGLLFLLGLHSPTLGVDVQGFYVQYFQNALDDSIYFVLIGKTEPLFHAFNYIIRSITDDVQVFLFLTAVFILLPLLFFFYKESKNPWFSIIFYVSFTLYFFAFSGLRQSMAISLICIGYYFLFRDKSFKFFCIVFLAMCFHTSALFAFVAYPLYKFKVSDKLWLLIFLPFSLLVFAIPSVMVFFVQVIFSDTGKYQTVLSGNSGSINLAFLYLAFAAFQFYLAKKNRQYRSMIQFTLLLFVIQLTGMKSNYASRIGYYFLPLLYIFIPNAISMVKNKRQSKQYLTAFVIFLIAFFFYANSGGDSLCIVPLSFYWED